MTKPPSAAVSNGKGRKGEGEQTERRECRKEGVKEICLFAHGYQPPVNHASVSGLTAGLLEPFAGIKPASTAYKAAALSLS